MTQPEQRDYLTYDRATPEQVAEARAWARETLRELDEHWTPERWAQVVAEHDRLRNTAA